MKNFDNKGIYPLEALIPPVWLAQLEAIAQQQGCAVETVLRNAIAQYLGIESTVTQTAPPWASIRQEITELQKKVTELEDNQHQVRRLSLQLQVLEHKLTQIQSSGSFVTPVPPDTSAMLSVENRDEEEFYDEPDEILTDFLP